jgi:hypothetical protein
VQEKNEPPRERHVHWGVLFYFPLTVPVIFLILKSLFASASSD